MLRAKLATGHQIETARPDSVDSLCRAWITDPSNILGYGKGTTEKDAIANAFRDWESRADMTNGANIIAWRLRDTVCKIIGG